MPVKLMDLATLVGGQLRGDGSVEIRAATILRDASPGDITLAENPQLADDLRQSKASAVVVPVGFEPAGIPFITVSDVRAAFAQVVQHFKPRHISSHVGVSRLAHVSSTAKLGDNVLIHPHASIDDEVKLGDGCIIHGGARIMAGCELGNHVTVFPNAVLYEDTIVGEHCVIHAGAVIGAYGFGYDTVDGEHQLGPQLGHVELGKHVHVGSGTTIDRGTYGATRIGDGTKIDNQVMIAHNCRIGKHNLLCSQVGIAGSVTTGDHVVMAGQVGIRDHVTIQGGVILGARSGVGQDIDEPGNYFGAPARPDRQQLQILFAQQKVPEMRRQLKDLERRVNSLTEPSDKHDRKDAA